MKIAIIGTGAYSLALATAMAKKDLNEIYMWTESEEKVIEFRKTGMIKSIFDGYKMPKNVFLSHSYEDVLMNADVVFIAVVAKYMDAVCADIKAFITPTTPVCIATKGIEQDTCKFVSDLYQDLVGFDNVSVISGPSFAIDIINDEPIGLSIASKNVDNIKSIKQVLENDKLKLRETSDLIGVQICGSIKNVIAIAAGVLSGLGYSESAQAFLITEATHDIKELIVGLNGDKRTVLSFSGIGDLLLTCTSIKSRNFSFGRIVGEGKTKSEIEEHLKNNTVEGYYTLKSIYSLVKSKNIEMPIIDLIYKIIMNYEDPKLLVDFLIKKK